MLISVSSRAPLILDIWADADIKKIKDSDVDISPLKYAYQTQKCVTEAGGTYWASHADTDLSVIGQNQLRNIVWASVSSPT